MSVQCKVYKECRKTRQNEKQPEAVVGKVNIACL